MRKYYVIKFENRPDGEVNQTMEARQSFATAMAQFYAWASTASATTNFVSVALTVMDNNGKIIENKLIPTAYEPETVSD